MKTVYVDLNTYSTSMAEKDGYTAIKTNAFDRMSDLEIENCFFIPEGYAYTDKYGVIYHGEFISPINTFISRMDTLSIVKQLSDTQKQVEEANTTISTLLSAIAELGTLVSEVKTNG